MGRDFEPDVAAMAARHVARDRQPEPHAPGRRVARAVEPNEGLEHPLAFGTWNAWPVIVDQDVNPVLDRHARQPDMAPILAGVGDQISKTPAQRVRPDDLQYFLADGLLKIDHEQRLMYPLDMFVSPLLAVLREENTEVEVGQQLGARSRQVLEMMEENLRLKVQVQKAQGKDATRDCPPTEKV